MSSAHIETRAVAQFQCLGDTCPDTCCVGWGMQLTAENVDHIRHEAPELLDAIVTGEAEFIMKRNPVTESCVKLEGGLCAIQRDYGAAMLGDACYFFPRITRALGDSIFTTAALSCPESARLMLSEGDAFCMIEHLPRRIPYQLKNYLPDGMTSDDALAIHQTFLDMASGADHDAEYHLLRISTVAQALAMQPVDQWKGAAAFYATIAHSRIPAAEYHAGDPFNLLHALHGLMQASGAARPSLKALAANMEQMLGVRFDDVQQKMHLSDDAAARAIAVQHHSRAQSKTLQPMMRRYVQAQISSTLFPFAGLGHSMVDRVTIMGVRLATVKLALATLAEVPAEAEVIRVVQTLSRLMDHLASPDLMLAMYGETGWVREPRLRALLDA